MPVMEYMRASRMAPMMVPMMGFHLALMTVAKMELVMASMTGFHSASMMVQTKVVKMVGTKADYLVLTKAVQTVWSSAETMAGMKSDCLALPTAV